MTACAFDKGDCANVPTTYYDDWDDDWGWSGDSDLHSSSELLGPIRSTGFSVPNKIQLGAGAFMVKERQ